MDVKKISEVVGALGIPVNELSKNVLSKPTTELGEGLGNLFWLVFSPIHAARNSLEPRINKFKEEIESKVAEIPSDRLVEPPLNIVGPTLEAAKYHIEHDEIRNLFAQLIASSMDSEKQDLTHPSFVEVIKQLSPFDAKILSTLTQERNLPIASIVAYEDSDQTRISRSYSLLLDDIMPFPEMNLENSYHYRSAIQNIRRLSLINGDYDKKFEGADYYSVLDNHPILEECINLYSNTERFPWISGRSIDFKKGNWAFTVYGDMFINSCYQTAD
ncbi:DUF4393 domain-containing protein [Paenibacillus sp. FSL P4-0081]|uniref:DUF4393 domain-containing protein n=1 Tax=Paenibacillus sp. FSL P4-0081 TaxID=1536769 RepID=UPI000693449B|nr:DUF4393 domain-containing protein [Paenibacillus sp. FSL P4-0081]